ncbi:MAG: phosphoribosylaminoimidazolesuccinocarboxamide synthase, partial [Ilumatobacteraceae bacterium]
ADAGYRGDGPPPELDPDVWTATTDRYVDAFERLTGRPFRPGAPPAAERIAARLPDLIEEYQ